MASYLLPWNEPGWPSEVSAWLSYQMETIGEGLVGELGEPRIRPWSVVIQVPTSIGSLYFKASAPALKHEAAVTHELAERFPDCIPHVYASDRARGWLLMASGHERLREVLRGGPDLRRWDRCLRRYSALQSDLAGRVDELIAIGVPDRRLAVLPTLLETLLEDSSAMPGDGEASLTSAELAWLHDFRSALEPTIQRLGSFGVPSSLDHGDFHDGNILVRDQDYLFFDWGDCGVTHPFISMRTVLVSFENTLGLSEDSASTQALVASYLEAWSADLDQPLLAEALDLSLRLSPIVAAHRWQLALHAVPSQEARRYSYPVPELLRELIERNQPG